MDANTEKKERKTNSRINTKCSSGSFSWTRNGFNLEVSRVAQPTGALEPGCEEMERECGNEEEMERE